MSGPGGAGAGAPSDELRQLLAHAAWADAGVWAAALACPGAPDDARLRTLLHHVHAVQRIYLRVLRGEAPTAAELESFDGFADLRAWGAEGHAELAAFVDGLTPDAGAGTVDFPWAARMEARFGRVVPATVGQALLQVSSHSTYHRGQVNARIRELGGEPALVDFIVWVWAGRPGADWTP